MSDKPVTLAAVTGAHGVTGEVRLKLLGEGYEALKPHKSFNGGSLTLTKLRSDNKGGAIARFAEVADRTAAEQLRGTALAKEAFEKFPEAINVAVERMIEEAKEMQRQEASRIVVPGQGSMGPGGPGGKITLR